MASIEFIQKRIDGKKAELDKLDAKLSRILKARESNYEENNPYYYNERDYTSTLKEIERAKKSLSDYENQLDVANSKAASRNVPAITEFLDKWEQGCLSYYREEYQKYLEDHRMYLNKNSELIDAWNKSRDREERKAIDKQLHELSESHRRAWTHVTQFDTSTMSWDDNMQRLVHEERNRKYDWFIDRLAELIGTIEDASHLSVGAKGDLNGFVIGTDGKASVQTVGAGGWNIQRWHYRTLIHKLKEN